MSKLSAEQQARDLLEQCGVEDAQSFSAGDVVALANYIADVGAAEQKLDAIRELAESWGGTRHSYYRRAILAILDREQPLSGTLTEREMAEIWADAHEVTKRERPVMRRRAWHLQQWLRAMRGEQP